MGVLTEAKAARLTHRAERLRRDGTRGMLAQSALDQLVQHGDDGDRTARDALWQVWVRHPEDVTWAALERWWTPSALAEAVFAAACDPRRPTADRAAIGAFCARHDLIPADASRRAVLFALTGQADQLRASDPDGSLLAAAYRGADEATRAALRHLLTSAGDLDVVRVVAGAEGGSQIERMTGEEVDYLVGQLTDRQEWERLWRLLRDAPLERAVAAMPRFGDWEPPGGTDRGLFVLLARTPPDRFAAGCATLRAAAQTTLEVNAHITSVSFAPDGGQVVVSALASTDPYHQPTAEKLLDPGDWATAVASVDVFALPHGRRVHRDESTRYTTTGTLHLGSAVLTAETDRIRPPSRRSNRLFRVAGGRRTVLWASSRQWDLVWDLTRRPGGGFVAAGGLSDGLIFGDTTGTGLRRVSLRDLGLTGPWAWAYRLAAEPGSGRFVVATKGTHDLAVVETDAPGLRLLARDADPDVAAKDMVSEAVFAGPDRLVTAGDDGYLRMWQRVGGSLRVEHRVRLPHPMADRAVTATSLRSLVPLPASGQVAVIGPDGTVSCFDARTLLPGAGPAEISGRRVSHLWTTPGGEGLAVGGADGRLDVYDPRLSGVAELLGRPVASLRPADVETVAAAERHDFHREIKQVIALLRACLEHRFAAEVALGSATADHGEEYDIVLSDTNDLSLRSERTTIKRQGRKG